MLQFKHMRSFWVSKYEKSYLHALESQGKNISEIALTMNFILLSKNIASYLLNTGQGNV